MTFTSNAFERGWQAFNAGKQRHEVPSTLATEEISSWQRGWDAGQAHLVEVRKLQGVAYEVPREPEEKTIEVNPIIFRNDSGPQVNLLDERTGRPLPDVIKDLRVENDNLRSQLEALKNQMKIGDLATGAAMAFEQILEALHRIQKFNAKYAGIQLGLTDEQVEMFISSRTLDPQKES